MAFDEALEVFNETIRSYGAPEISSSEFRDYDINDETTVENVVEFAKDFINDWHTEKAEEQHIWRYND